MCVRTYQSYSCGCTFGYDFTNKLCTRAKFGAFGSCGDFRTRQVERNWKCKKCLDYDKKYDENGEKR